MFLFRYDSKLNEVITKFVKLVFLGLVWLLFSLPLFTIGASSISLAQYCLQLSKNEDGYIFSSYRKSFIQNLKQGIQVWIPTSLFCLLFIGDYVYYGSVFLIFGCVGLVYYRYLIFVMAKFENTLKGHLRMALILIVRTIPIAAIILIMNIVYIAVVYFSDYMLFIPLIGVMYFIQTIIFDFIFSKQISKGGIIVNE